jgi:integrase
MGCVRKRRGAWVVDYYDLDKRRVKTFDTKREAEDFNAELNRKRALQTVPVDIDPRITVATFAPVFLARCKALAVRDRTLTRYEAALSHIVAALGDIEVRQIDRSKAEAFLTAKVLDVGSRQGQKGPEAVAKRRLKRSSVAHLLRVLSNLMGAAVARGLVPVNPLGGLARQLKLGKKRKGEKPKALTAEQLAILLGVAGRDYPDLAWAFAVMAGAGLRVGEVLALAWDRYVDLAARVIHVEEQLDGPLKDSDPRDVPMSPGLHAVLTALRAGQKAAALRHGRDLQDHLFDLFDRDRGPQAQQRVVKRLQRAFARVLQTAGLPTHHTMHSLRHSFASIQISKGVPIAAVRGWLGHASIVLTVDLYGSWLPTEAEVLELLPVAKGASTGNKAEELARASA